MISLKNNQLVPVTNLLNKIHLKNSESRSRSKFVRLLMVKVEELQQDEIFLLEQYSNKDENNKAIVNNGVYDVPTDKEALVAAEREKLFEETSLIDCSEYKDHMFTLYKALVELDMDLNGEDARAYDLLLDEMEENNYASN